VNKADRQNIKDMIGELIQHRDTLHNMCEELRDIRNLSIDRTDDSQEAELVDLVAAEDSLDTAIDILETYS
jgi:hypothetical protein